MAIENDPASRMHVLSMGELQSPGSCYVCGSGVCNEGYVDFGTFVDYHGNFYLCMTCAVQLAETIGFVSPEALTLLSESMEAKLIELAESQEELADARKHVDAVNTVLSSRFSASFGDGDLSKNPYEPYEGGEAGEPESEESTPLSRSANAASAKSRNFTD